MDSAQPTEEGKRRYDDEPVGYYDDGCGGKHPCTCQPTCVRPCKGECGCEACRVSYSDFLSGE